MQLSFHNGVCLPKPEGFISLHHGFWTLHDHEDNFRYTFSDADDMINRQKKYGSLRFASMDNNPAIILETMVRNTGGDTDRIPKTSKELMGERGSAYETGGDTLFLVTYTVKPDLRKIVPDGYVERLTDIGLSHYLREVLDNFEFCITYSPDVKPAIEMHKRHRAQEIGIVLPKARSGLSIAGTLAEDVRPMGYKWPGIKRE